MEYGKNNWYYCNWELICNYPSHGDRSKSVSEIYWASCTSQWEEVWSSLYCFDAQHESIGNFSRWHFLGKDTIFIGYYTAIIVSGLRELLCRSFTLQSLWMLYALLSLCCYFHFQVRLANNTYSLDKHSLFEYETHFTVMVSLWKFMVSGCLTAL